MTCKLLPRTGPAAPCIWISKAGGRGQGVQGVLKGGEEEGGGKGGEKGKGQVG